MSYFSAQQFHAHAMHDHSAASMIIRGVSVPYNYDMEFYMELDTSRKPTLNQTKKFLSKTKELIYARNATNAPRKWLRPWNVVPALKDLNTPVGEYAVGVEIELGFVTLEAAQQVAQHIKDWKYITLDFEGGENPIEVTFPPINYKKFGKKSQPMRYLKYLQENAHLVTQHAADHMVGTHINVSKGGSRVNTHRLRILCGIMAHFDGAHKLKYFGRAQPYRYGVSHGTDRNDPYTAKYIEWKLFNSDTDPATLQRYVRIAVALTSLVYNQRVVTTDLVLATLEKAYNAKR